MFKEEREGSKGILLKDYNHERDHIMDIAIDEDGYDLIGEQTLITLADYQLEDFDKEHHKDLQPVLRFRNYTGNYVTMYIRKGHLHRTVGHNQETTCCGMVSYDTILYIGKIICGTVPYKNLTKANLENYTGRLQLRLNEDLYLTYETTNMVGSLVLFKSFLEANPSVEYRLESSDGRIRIE